MRERRSNIEWSKYLELARKHCKTMSWTQFARQYDLPEASGAIRMRNNGITFLPGRHGPMKGTPAPKPSFIQYNGNGERAKVEFEVYGVTIACAPQDVKTILEGFKNA